MQVVALFAFTVTAPAVLNANAIGQAERQNMTTIQNVCQEDMRRLCTAVDTIGAAAMECLSVHQEEAMADCKSELRAVKARRNGH